MPPPCLGAPPVGDPVRPLGSLLLPIARRACRSASRSRSRSVGRAEVLRSAHQAVLRAPANAEVALEPGSCEAAGAPFLSPTSSSSSQSSSLPLFGVRNEEPVAQLPVPACVLASASARVCAAEDAESRPEVVACLDELGSCESRTGSRSRSRGRPRRRSRHGFSAAGCPASGISGSLSSKALTQQLATGERWLALRPILEEEFGCDSWNVRDAPCGSARIISHLNSGEVFRSSEVFVGEDDAWLEVRGLSSGLGYAARCFCDTPRSGPDIEAFAPPGTLEIVQSTSRRDRGCVPAEDRIRDLLRDLAALRRRYEQPSQQNAAGIAEDEVEVDREADAEAQRVTGALRVYYAVRIQDVMSELEFLGVDCADVFNREHLPSLLLRRRSFAHRQFANPDAESCWLSCLFQSLWHSVVFHAAFELYLAASRCQVDSSESSSMLRALQRTWEEYTKETESTPRDDDPQLVPVHDLVEGFGQGYGDMSEALAKFQGELEACGDPAVVAVGSLFAIVPLSVLGPTWPTPSAAWQTLEDWAMMGSALVAVDLSLAPLSRASIRHLADLWVPAAGAQSNLGPNHRLVSLVCFMPTFQHYVAFCCRQSDSSRCLFFNDLPGLTGGAPRDVGWEDVPDMCFRYMLIPRLALFESPAAAAKAGEASGGSPGAEGTASDAAGAAGAQHQAAHCRQQ